MLRTGPERTCLSDRLPTIAAVLLIPGALVACADDPGTGRRPLPPPWGPAEASRRPIPASSGGVGVPFPMFVEFCGRTLPAPSGRAVYVLDRSGSENSPLGQPYVDRFGNTVNGTRWEFQVDRTISSIQGLPASFRFNIITYACDRTTWSPVTLPATQANKADAEAWLLGEYAWGGSGIGPAGAFALQDKDVLTFLLTSDGQIDCGPSGLMGHLAVILAANTQGANVHTVGIAAFGQFEQFMIDVATLTGGTYTPVP